MTEKQLRDERVLGPVAPAGFPDEDLQGRETLQSKAVQGGQTALYQTPQAERLAN